MKKTKKNENIKSQPQKEEKSYTVEELLKLGKETNSMNFAKTKESTDPK